MTWPHFPRTLHFRISAVFLALMAVVFLGYYQWVDHTLYQVEFAPGEEQWLEQQQDAEIDSLAHLLAVNGADSCFARDLMQSYERRIRAFDAEAAVFDSTGRAIAATHQDSLMRVVRWVSPSLLDSMARPGWDFSTYPDPYDVDSYVNRIVSVAAVRADSDTTRPPLGWVVATFKPIDADMQSLESEQRVRLFRGAMAMLVVAVLGGLIVLAWVSRRIRRLNAAMLEYSGGDYDRRAGDRSRDEIGELARTFDTLADRLAETIRQLREAERQRRQLVANISHDLRTPLASLRGRVERLTDRTGDDPERQRELAAMQVHLESLEGLIERLFALSQLDSPLTADRAEDFPLPELAEDVLTRCENLAQRRGVSLSTATAGELPLVHADPLRVGQILQNLVENGIKFNREGGAVTVEMAPDPEGVRVTVRDTGTGIAPEDLPHIFERFYTGDRSRSGRSAGLGLAIVQRSLERMGRRVEVASEPGRGSAFTFTLPAA